MFLQNYRVDFSHIGLNGTLYTFMGAFSEQKIDFNPCTKIPTVRKCRKFLKN